MKVWNKIVWEGTISLSKGKIWPLDLVSQEFETRTKIRTQIWVQVNELINHKNMLYFIFYSSYFPCLKKNVWKERGKCDIIVDIIKSRDYGRVAQCLRICFAMQWMWVWSLVGKLRSHRPWGNETDMPKLKNSCATRKNLNVMTKIQCSQINIFKC